MLLAALSLVAGACSEKDKEQVSGDEGSPFVPSTDCTGGSALECAPEGTTIDALLPDEPTQAEGEPIKVGMMNTESGPATAFPELTRGAEAGVEFINQELGGVDGRPIELVTCDVEFSGTGSLACGQRMVEEGVVAVLGGIDVFGDGIQVLQDNDIPLVGGIPVSFISVESPISFQFSGGSWGQNLGLVHHMVNELEAEKVSIVYGDFGPVTDGAEWARRALIDQGLAEENIKMVPTPIVVEDLLTPLQAADEGDPDAILVLVADSGCGAAYQAIADAGIDAQTYWSGGCLEPTMVEAIGAEAIEGNIYALENSLDPENPDQNLYGDVIELYGENVDAGSAATVAFGALMNLYSVMRSLGADDISAQSIMEDLRSAEDRPSYGGHPYTCDGAQMGGALPAICAPQQILAQMQDGELVQISDWIEVADLIPQG